MEGQGNASTFAMQPDIIVSFVLAELVVIHLVLLAEMN